MDLLKNPFHILGASPRDNRQRIMELADERSLLSDPNECMEARSILTNPRKRLSAEIAWLPGIGPKRAEEMLSRLESSPAELLAIDTLPAITRANLLAAGLTRLSEYRLDSVTEWILEIAVTFEDIDSEKLCAIINEERHVSAFPMVTDSLAIEDEIQERRRYYGKIIKSALDNLPARELVKAVTIVAETATDDGEEHGPLLVANLIDTYEIEARDFLEKEEKTIKSLVEKLRTAVDAKHSDSVLTPMVTKLIQVVKNWDTVAQPIQISAKSQGLDHDASLGIAKLLREFALYLHNEQNKTEFSLCITNIILDVFAEVDSITEWANDDKKTLDRILEQKKQRELLEPIYALCESASEIAKNQPYLAGEQAVNIINSAERMLAELHKSENSNTENMLIDAKNIISITLMNCAIAYGNKTSQWGQCIDYLQNSLKYSCDEDIYKQIISNIYIATKNKQESDSQRNKNLVKFIFYAGIALFILYQCSTSSTSSTNSSRERRSSNIQTQQDSQSGQIDFRKPNDGSGNTLAISEIRWCLREKIAVDAMRPLVNEYSERSVNYFNSAVRDYNSRCGNFRYRKGDLERARQEVESLRGNIMYDARARMNVYR